jgi:hypothetical protein
VGVLVATDMRLWNRLTKAPPGSLLHTSFGVSCQLVAIAPATQPLARQSWAAQVAAALQGIGVLVDLARPRPLCLEQLKRSALRRHLHEIQSAPGQPGASKLAHDLAATRGGQLPGAEEYVPLSAAYLGAVRQRSRRVAIAQLRTRSHWPERRRGGGSGCLVRSVPAPLPGRARGCATTCVQPTCVQHALFVCPLYSPVRARFPDLVFEPTVHAFLEQAPVLIAAFVAESQRTHAAGRHRRPG